MVLSNVQISSKRISSDVEKIVDAYEKVWGNGDRNFRLMPTETNSPKANLKTDNKILIVGNYKDWCNIYGRCIYAKNYYPEYQVFCYLTTQPLKNETFIKVEHRKSKYQNIADVFTLEGIRLWIDDYWWYRNQPVDHQFF